MLPRKPRLDDFGYLRFEPTPALQRITSRATASLRAPTWGFLRSAGLRAVPQPDELEPEIGAPGER